MVLTQHAARVFRRESLESAFAAFAGERMRRDMPRLRGFHVKPQPQRLMRAYRRTAAASRTARRRYR